VRDFWENGCTERLYSRSPKNPTLQLYRTAVQPFSQKSHTPTVAKEFQIGLYDPAEADLEHFWNCCSEGFLGERLYAKTYEDMLVLPYKRWPRYTASNRTMREKHLETEALVGRTMNCSC